MSGERVLGGRGGLFSIFTQIAKLSRERKFQRQSIRQLSHLGWEDREVAKRRAGKALRLLRRLGSHRFHGRAWYGIASRNRRLIVGANLREVHV